MLDRPKIGPSFAIACPQVLIPLRISAKVVSSFHPDMQPRRKMMFTRPKSGQAAIAIAATSVALASTVLAEIHDVDVDLTNGTFTPSKLTIAPGDLVRWTAIRSDVIFADSFATDLGWTVKATSETGQWNRRIPYPGCSDARGKVVEAVDHDRWCMMTGAGWAECLDDVDAGSVALTSPEIELDGDTAFVSFSQWFSNSSGNNPFQNPMTTIAIVVIGFWNGLFPLLLENHWEKETNAVSPSSSISGEVRATEPASTSSRHSAQPAPVIMHQRS